MIVKIVVKDRSLEVVDIREYDFQEFCTLLSKKVQCCLHLTEDCLDPESPVTISDIRSTILDVAGDISRLPSTIQFPKDVM